MRGENDGFFIIKQIKKPRLCSVLFGNSTQEEGEHSPAARVSFYTSFVLSPLPACFTTEQSTVEASLFVNQYYRHGIRIQQRVHEHVSNSRRSVLCAMN